MEYAGFAIVKALGVPGRMVTLGTVMEELPGGAIKHIDTFCGILDGMGVYHIQQNPQPHAVGGIDQIFQIFRLTKPGGSSVEIGDLIAKGTVVGMLHDGHKLDGVVTGFLDMGENIIGEFPIGADFSLFLGHAYMGFINIKFVLACKILIRPGEGFTVVLNFTGKGDGFRVLNHPAGIQGNVLCTGQVCVHNGFHLAAFPQRIVTFQEDFPVAVSDVLQRVTGFIPVIELSLQVELIGAGGPFPVVPPTVNVVESVVIVGVGKIRQGLISRQKTSFRCVIQEHPQINIPGKRLKLGI